MAQVMLSGYRVLVWGPVCLFCQFLLLGARPSPWCVAGCIVDCSVSFILLHFVGTLLSRTRVDFNCSCAKVTALTAGLICFPFYLHFCFLSFCSAFSFFEVDSSVRLRTILPPPPLFKFFFYSSSPGFVDFDITDFLVFWMLKNTFVYNCCHVPSPKHACLTACPPACLYLYALSLSLSEISRDLQATGRNFRNS